MTFPNTRMLCVQVMLVVVLAVGDCSLSPILRPLMSLLDGSRLIRTIPSSKLSRAHQPSLSLPPPPSYRIQGSISPPFAQPMGMTTDNRWDGLNLGIPNKDVAVPNIAPVGIGIKSPEPIRLEAKRQYMMKPDGYDINGPWDGGEGNSKHDITVKPVKNDGFSKYMMKPHGYDISGPWDGGDGNSKHDTIVKPMKNEGLSKYTMKPHGYDISGPRESDDSNSKHDIFSKYMIKPHGYDISAPWDGGDGKSKYDITKPIKNDGFSKYMMKPHGYDIIGPWDGGDGNSKHDIIVKPIKNDGFSKYMMKPYGYDISGSWDGGDRNSKLDITVKPIKNDGYSKYMMKPHGYDISGSWDGGDGNSKHDIIVKPIKNYGFSKYMMKPYGYDISGPWDGGDRNSKHDITVKPIKIDGHSKYMTKPHGYDISGPWDGGDGKSKHDIIFKPLKNDGYRGINKSWMINKNLGEANDKTNKYPISITPMKPDGYTDIKNTWMTRKSSGEHRDMSMKQSLYISPDNYKNNGPRNYNERAMIYGDSGEKNGVINKKIVSHDSHEVSVTPLKGRDTKNTLINDYTISDNDWVNSRSIEEESAERSGSGEHSGKEMYWRSTWMNKGFGQDPDHDTDDQPDHNMRDRVVMEMKPKQPESSDEKTSQIWIITTDAKPILSRLRAYLHTRNARKHILRHGYRSDEAEKRCISCY